MNVQDSEKISQRVCQTHCVSRTRLALRSRMFQLVYTFFLLFFYVCMRVCIYLFSCITGFNPVYICWVGPVPVNDLQTLHIFWAKQFFDTILRFLTKQISKIKNRIYRSLFGPSDHIWFLVQKVAQYSVTNEKLIFRYVRFLVFEILAILYSKFLELWPKCHRKWPNWWGFLRFCSRLDQNVFEKTKT